MRYNWLAGILLLLSLVFSSEGAVATEGWCDNEQSFNRYVRIGAEDKFFTLEFPCIAGKVSAASSFDQGKDFKGQQIGSETYRFEYQNGYRSIVRLKQKSILNISYHEAEVVLHKGAQQLKSFATSGDVMFDRRKPSCSFSHGDGGFYTEVIELTYPRSITATLISASSRYGWYPIEYGDYDFVRMKPTRLRKDRLFDKPETCKGDLCTLPIQVGAGNEFFALDTYNAIDPRVCARLIAGEAGGPPMRVAGIPLNTLTDHTSPAIGGTRQALKSKVLPKLFGPHATTTEPSASGQGKTFVFSVLGPNKALGVSLKKGYWYKGNISISVGIDAGFGAVGESVHLTVLDLTEIRAPEDLASLPSGVQASGRTLEYLNAGAVTEDGEVITSWSKLLATKIADATGGFVEGF